MRSLGKILFFKATYNTKTNKQFTYLLPVVFLRKEEGTRLTSYTYSVSDSCRLPSSRIYVQYVSLVPSSFRKNLPTVRQSRALFLPQESRWQKISELFVCVSIVGSFEKGYFLQISHLVLADWKAFFFTLCVFLSLLTAWARRIIDVTRTWPFTTWDWAVPTKTTSPPDTTCTSSSGKSGRFEPWTPSWKTLVIQGSVSFLF